MKKIIGLLFLFTLYLNLMICVSAEETSELLVVKQFGGEYRLYSGENMIESDNDIGKIIELSDGKRLYFDNVRVYETVVLEDGEYCLSGSAYFEDEAGLGLNKGCKLVADGLSVRLSCGSIFVNGGSLAVVDSELKSEGEYVVYAEGEESFLSVLGDSIIAGEKYGILGDIKLSFCSEGGEKYTGKEPIKYCYVGESNILSEIVNLIDADASGVRLFFGAENERQIYKVTFVSENGESVSFGKLRGEPLSPPLPPEKYGYEFVGWSLDGEIVSGDYKVASDSAFYAKYALVKPRGYADGVSFVYDGCERYLELRDIYHPLLSYGRMECKWYLDGEEVFCGAKMPVKDVSDSGSYSAVLEFSFSGESSSIKLGTVDVKIEPKLIELEYIDNEFVIVSGEIAEGDIINIEEKESNGSLYAEIDNKNYCLNFSPVKIKTNKINIVAITVVLGTVFLLMLSAYLVFKSNEKDKIVKAVSLREDTSREKDAFVLSNVTEDIEKSFFAVDKARADELINDRMAKNMIFPGGVISASGTLVCDVSVGVISDNFANGERVDINSLRERGIIPQDTFKIKITADGSLSKELFVFANDFELSAVKMIALCSGRCSKVKSKKKKNLS